MRMRMTPIKQKIIVTLVSADLLLGLASILFFDTKTLWNTQIGFFSSALVMIASMISYRRMVTARVENNIITLDDSKDVIDKLEDPHDLYSEENVETEAGEKAFSDVVKEEKKKLKENRRTLFQVLKDTKAALSLYRLGAYGVLILGFLYLNRHGLLHVPSYIVGLSFPIVIMVVLLLQDKENHSQDAVK